MQNNIPQRFYFLYEKPWDEIFSVGCEGDDNEARNEHDKHKQYQ